VDHRLVEDRHCLSQTLNRVHQAILVFDAENVVVTDGSQDAAEVLPPLQSVAVADGAEHPRSLGDVAVALGVQVSVERRVLRIDSRVLCVNVEERALFGQLLHRRNRVDSLPPKVRWVEVRANLLTRCVAEFKQGVVAVANKPRVHLDAELNVVLLQKGVLLGPVRNHNFLPLVLEDVAELVGPGASDPVRVDRRRAVARASREAVDARHTQQASEFDAVHKRLVVILRDRLHRVQGVAVARDRGDHEPAAFYVVNQLLPRGVALQQLLNVKVRSPRIRSGSKLNGLNAFGRDDIERLLASLVSE